MSTVRTESNIRKKEALRKLREEERLGKINDERIKLEMASINDVANLKTDAEKKLQDYKTKLDNSVLVKIAKKKTNYKKKIDAIEERKKKVIKTTQSFTRDELMAAAISKYDKKQQKARSEIIKTANTLGFDIPNIKPEHKGSIKPEHNVSIKSDNTIIDLTSD